MVLTWIILLLLSYLLGAIPFSFLLVRWIKGVDVRTIGSGNPGSTNAVRAAGRPVGIAVFLCDGLKSYFPTLVGLQLGGASLAAACAGVAFLGHIFPIWLNFKGGKGAATSYGAALALSPILAIVTIGVWLLITVISGYVSIGTCSAAFFILLAALLMGQPFPYVLLYFFILIVILLRHKGNFQRILAGEDTPARIWYRNWWKRK